MYRVCRGHLLFSGCGHVAGVHSVCSWLVQRAYHGHVFVHRLPRGRVRRLGRRHAAGSLCSVRPGLIRRPQRRWYVVCVHSVQRGHLQRAAHRRRRVHCVCGRYLQDCRRYPRLHQLRSGHIQQCVSSERSHCLHGVPGWYL